MARIVGVDVGGTFTDLVLHDDATGAVHVAKVPSTPADQSIGLVEGLRALPCAPEELGLIVHGTTVATNAVLERKGARCGLIMTEGFRDVLELRRRDRPDTYGLKGSFRPLVSRDLRTEVSERTDFRGNVLEAPDEGEVTRAAELLLARGAEVVIVSFINSYANPENERRARAVLEHVWPNPYIVTASEVLPEIREFERTSTAVLNGYVQPLMERYLGALMERLAALGYRHDVLLIQCNGGVMSQQVARRFSVNTILSGPAAGVIAAERIGRRLGEPNLVTCDIGGTSLDIAVVAGGRAATARETSLAYGIPMRTTMLDIRTVGAGGGSIAWLDRAGILQIGPHSAGAEPGPACYGQGGRLPTVTDANLVLGRIGAEHPIGREQGRRFHPDIAEAAIEAEIARPLGLSAVETAWAILQVANHKIAAAIRMMTVERGHDPRDFALVAYGGAGPLHAAAMVEELEIARAIVPPWPGITSALGCILADVRHDFVQTLNRRLDELTSEEIAAVLRAHEVEGRAVVAGEGIPVERIEVRYRADIAYDGQIHEVTTDLPAPDATREQITRAFEQAYAAQYGAALEGRPVRIRTLGTAVIGVRQSGELLAPVPGDAATVSEAVTAERPVYVDGGFVTCPIYERALLPRDASFAGPAVIEQGDATTVVEPAIRARTEPHGNLILEPSG